MGKYYVQLPLSGILGVEVEADNEDEAIGKAQNVDWNITVQGDVDIQELETHEKMVEGNIVHASLWEAEVEKIE